MFFERLAHFVIRRRRWVVCAWILLFVLGLFTTSKIGSRWFESFSIPGYSAYEANQRTLKTFGSGEQAPLVAVFRSNGDVTGERGIAQAIIDCRGRQPGSRTASYFSTGSDAYVSKDRHTTFARSIPRAPPGSTRT